eukprot:Pgem_evm1s19875
MVYMHFKGQVGGYGFKNWFFGDHSRNKNHKITGRNRMIKSIKFNLTIAKYIFSSTKPYTSNRRQKLIVNPKNVKYFAIHEIAQGGPMVNFNPHNTARMCHFKQPKKGVFSRGLTTDLVFEDQSMAISYADLVAEKILLKLKFDLKQ